MIWTLSKNTLTVTFKATGTSTTITDEDPRWAAARAAILDDDVELTKKVLAPAKTFLEIITEDHPGWSVKNEEILFEGVAVPTPFREALTRAYLAGIRDLTPYFQFWRKLSKNPSYRSVEQTWTFLNHVGIPLDPEGNILAYKSVRADYFDHHSGTLKNTVGAILSMPRNRISDDPRTPCHEGLHVGALGYARTFGSGSPRIMICRVDPADVVCVPYDESAQKMRTCRYEVVGEWGPARNESVHHLPSFVFAADPTKGLLGEGYETLVTINLGDAPPPEGKQPSPTTPSPEEEDSNDLGGWYVSDDEDEEEEDDDLDESEDEDTACVAQEEVLVLTGLEIEPRSAPANTDCSGKSLSWLRTFAAHVLKIPRASKIPGGRAALLAAIQAAQNPA